MRRAYVALSWPSRDAAAAARAQQLGARLAGDGGWVLRGHTDRSSVWVAQAAPFTVRPLAHAAGFVIGDLYEVASGPASGSPLHRPDQAVRHPVELARRLTRAHWGQYVALLHGVTVETAAYREPTGMVDCLTWSLPGGVEVVASDMTRLPGWLRPAHAFLNWSRIADFLVVPTAATTPALFDSVEAVGPGELLRIGGKRVAPEVIWSPLAFAREATSDLRAAGADLVAVVDQCTADLVGGHDRILVELSGGLDSSVLAGALQATGQSARVAQWLNITDPRPEADESRYARAVTDRLGVSLTLIHRPPGRVATEDLADLANAVWPGLAGVDALRDRDAVSRIRSTGATAILSGQGGDGAFFQMGSALVVADDLRRRGLAALASPRLPDIARRTHRSVWGVLGEVWAAQRGRAPARKVVNSLVTADCAAASAGVEHAWVQAAQGSGLPLGKQLHIRALATNHFNHGVSRRRREADLLFPLLSQPVLERCLPIATPDLAGAAYDRPFQRAIFADRLPPAVRDRRAKGDLSVYFAKLMANSVETLRPFLLEGSLCAAGVLDRRTLERVLDPNYLILEDVANDLVGAAAVEAWVRYWQTQVPDSLRAGRIY